MSDEQQEAEDASDRERQYATVNETATSLRISTSKLREWIKSGMIETIRPGGKYGHIRVSIQSVKDFLERHTTKKRGDDE